MGNGRPPTPMQKVITTLEFLSVCSLPVRDIFAYWERRRGSRRMPSPLEIDPSDFPNHLPGIVVVEVRHDPQDFIYRSVGAREVSARGADPTGKSVNEYWYGGSMEAVLSNYRYVTSQGAFLYEFERFVGPSGRLETDETLFMPLSLDDRTVTEILTYSHYEDIWRKQRP
jgi:hypothetical protein